MKRTRVGLFAATLLVAALAAPPVAGQCALSVRPQPGETGYRQRGHGCEGMYVGLQSAPLNVQVVSLVKGGLTYRLDAGVKELQVRVPPSLASDRELGSRVLVLGRAREANLNWALDGFASPGKPMMWRLDDVVLKERLASNRIGVYGETKRADGMGGPVYVPLDVREPSDTKGPAGTIELIVRIPAAAAASWSVGAASERYTAEPLNADGYFRILLPAATAPEKARLAVYWRPRGEMKMTDVPEHLRIYRW